MPNKNFISLIPENDAARLEKLYEYQILDTHSEDTFDKITLMAAQIFEVQSAFIIFVDKERVFLKSNLSEFPFTEAPRESSLNALAILSDDVTVFEDTRKETFLINNPVIALEGGVRFYAGAPLVTPEGYNVGTICVGGAEPMKASQKQLDMLKTLSKIVVDKLENRLRYRKTVESHLNVMNIALHEIKNPLASINLANDIIAKDPSTIERMSGMIRSSVNRIQNKLSELLQHSEHEETELKLSIEEIDIRSLLTRILNNFELLAVRKKQQILMQCDENLEVMHADKVKISDVLHNLLSNAIKYSYHGSTITVTATEDDGHVCIEVKDEGQGLDDDDVTKLFTKFAKLSSKPTGKETSNGLGLSITKSLVELHNGTIEAVSEGKDKGTSFIVRLPQRKAVETNVPELV